MGEPPIDPADLRMAMAMSDQLAELVLAVAAEPPMRPELWPHDDQVHALQWACGQRADAPGQVLGWIERVRKRLQS